MKKNPLAYSPHLQSNNRKAPNKQWQWNVQGSNSARITAANSNTRIISAKKQNDASKLLVVKGGKEFANIGLNSIRMREQMVQRLKARGITDRRILDAMLSVPRHVFVGEGLASRAYEEAALPIGFSQTISQPYVVARMLSVVIEGRQANKVLEIGTGCGYQVAIMAKIFNRVHSIERIKGLHELAKANLNQMHEKPFVHLYYADGRTGLAMYAPFDAIVIAAAGLEIPDALLRQLAIGGRLIAPEGGDQQHLVLIERISEHKWQRNVLEEVRFVPLLQGIQS